MCVQKVEMLEGSQMPGGSRHQKVPTLKASGSRLCWTMMPLLNLNLSKAKRDIGQEIWLSPAIDCRGWSMLRVVAERHAE